MKNTKIKRFFTFTRLRFVFMLTLFSLLALGSVSYTGIGTVCAYCPVGVMQTASASLSVTAYMLACLAGAALLALVFGRIFCSWGCPTEFLRGIFGSGGRGVKSSSCASVPRGGLRLYSAYVVLAVSVAGSFAVGFPVFCLVCPIGLFFGFIFSLHRLFVSYQPGWELIVFPAVIAAEILLFKKWCVYICPIGAFFRLVSKAAGPLVSLGADKASCAVLNGGSCHVCANSCREGISIPERTAEDGADCTLCLNCADKCPNNAVKVRSDKISA